METRIPSVLPPRINPPASEQSEFGEFTDFLQTELGTSVSGNPRRVVALTEGLGLESPSKRDTQLKTELAPGLPLGEKLKLWPPTLQAPPPDPFFSAEAKDSKLAAVIEKLPLIADDASRLTNNAVTAPPPFPHPSGFKRLLALVLDQLLVWTIFVVTLAITSNALSGFRAGFSLSLLNKISDPAFLRIASLEFVVIWITYLTFTLCLETRSFGMWVWGIRVSYGNPEDENYFMRKAMRVFWSLLFQAPLVPLILLVFRRNGKNLLDTLSGTNLYTSSTA